MNKEALKREVEKVIQNLPSQINDSRDVTRLSNVDEAIKVLNSKDLLTQRYDLEELITDQLTKDVVSKAALLRNAVFNLTEQNPSLAVYMCTPICNTIGFVNDTFVLIDTHCISTELGSSGDGFIKLVHCEDNTESRKAGADAVVNWLEQRMTHVVGYKRGRELLLHLAITENTTHEPMVISLSDEEDTQHLAPSEDECPHYDHVNMSASSASQSLFHDMLLDDEDDDILATLTPFINKSPKGPKTPSLDRPTEADKQDFALWQHPSQDDETDETMELLWRGYLTKFRLSSLKKFHLDAIRAIEKKKGCRCSTKNWQWKTFMLSASLPF